MTSLISDLPNSLVEQILSRLPLKSMRSVRLTCKEWDTLSKSRSFAKMHIDKLREGEPMVIATMDNNLYLNEDPVKGKFVCLDKKIKISQVFHCDGLLLCVLEEDDTKVIVWNPYWGQTRSIETRYYHRPYGCDDGFCYAVGYEDKKSCRRSYKILRFIDYHYEIVPEDQFVLYEIYGFDSGLWRTLDVTPHWRIWFGQGALSLKGNTYWPASRRNSVQEGLSDDHIICFDFTSETFQPLLPLPFGRIPGYVTLSCVREEEEEEKLGVLLRWPYLEFGTWATAKIEAEKVSWSEQLSVDTQPFFFIDDEEKEVTTGSEDDFFILDYTHCSAHTCSYVPSLAQIKQPAAGCKRKQKCDLETQEYD